MPKIYCRHCNQPTDYSNVKPNHCSSCGKSFTTSLASFSKVTLEVEEAPRKSKPTPIKFELDTSGDNDSSSSEPITQIKLEIEPVKFARSKETVDNLVFDKSPKVQLQREKVIKSKKIDKKKVLAEFQNETKSCKYARQLNSTPVE